MQLKQLQTSPPPPPQLKTGASTGFEPMASALALQYSNQLSYEDPYIGSRPICKVNQIINAWKEWNIEWWCELQKYKFIWRYDHCSGKCNLSNCKKNRKKKIRDFNGKTPPKQHSTVCFAFRTGFHQWPFFSTNYDHKQLATDNETLFLIFRVHWTALFTLLMFQTLTTILIMNFSTIWDRLELKKEQLITVFMNLLPH